MYADGDVIDASITFHWLTLTTEAQLILDLATVRAVSLFKAVLHFINLKKKRCNFQC